MSSLPPLVRSQLLTLLHHLSQTPLLSPLRFTHEPCHSSTLSPPLLASPIIRQIEYLLSSSTPLTTTDYCTPIISLITSPNTSGLTTGICAAILSTFISSSKKLLVDPNPATLTLLIAACTDWQFVETAPLADSRCISRVIRFISLVVENQLLTDDHYWAIYTRMEEVVRESGREDAKEVVSDVIRQVCEKMSPQFQAAAALVNDMDDNWGQEDESPSPTSAPSSPLASPPPATPTPYTAITNIITHLTETPPESIKYPHPTFALTLLNQIFTFPLPTSLHPILSTSVCKYLLLLSTTNDLTILSLLLRVVFTLFKSLKSSLKIQLEVFLQSIHLRILNGPPSSIPNEAAELALLSLLEFCSEPSLMVDVYVNYDCDISYSNLFDNIVNTLFLYATSQERFGVLQRMGGTGIIDIVQNIERRCVTFANGKAVRTPAPPDFSRGRSNSSSSTVTSDDADSSMYYSDSEAPHSPSPTLPSHFQSLASAKTSTTLALRKKRKEQLTSAGAIFNGKSKKWIDECKKTGVFDLADPAATPAATDVAKFLYNAPGVDRTLLGEYLSKGPPEQYPFNTAVLAAFCALFDFSNSPFGSSLRKFLTKFRLPGEAQCIDRLMEAFASQVFLQTTQRSYFADADAAFILSFSTIMLNTDLHNPNLPEEKRMTLSQFIRNNRGINGGGDIDQAFLTSLYNHIKDEEIQVSMEASTVADDVRKLDGLLERATDSLFYEVDVISGEHERDMWWSVSDRSRKSLLTTLSRSKDDVVVSRCADGWDMYAFVCQHFDDVNGFNELLLQTCRSAGEFVRNMLTIKIQPQTKQALLRRVISPTAERGMLIHGAAEHRHLLALATAITLTSKFTNILDKGWSGLLELLFLLRNHNALPDALGGVEDFADSDGRKLPNSPFRERAESRAKEYLQQNASEGDDAGGSWWGVIFGDGEEEEEEEQELASTSSPEDALTTPEFIKELVSNAQLDVAFTDTHKMSEEAHLKMVRSLLSCRALHDSGEESPTFEDQAVVMLELSSRVLLRSGDRAERVWDIMVEYLEKIMKSQTMPYLMERATVTILRAGIYMQDSKNPAMQQKLMNALTMITFVPGTILRHISDRVGSGLAIILRSGVFTDEKGGWALICSLLDKTCEYSGGRHFGWEGVRGWLDRASDEDVAAGWANGGLYYLTSVLLKFVGGAYQGDMKYSGDAMDVLADLWGKNNDKSQPALLDMAAAFHTCLSSRDPELAKKASKLLNKLLCTTKAETVSYDNWMRIYHTVLLEPPKIVQVRGGGDVLNEEIRVTCTETLARVVLLTVPRLLCERQPKVGSELKLALERVVVIMGENVRARSTTGLIFENTVQLVQNMYMVMGLADEFDGGFGLGEMVKDLLVKEMDSAGAGGVLAEQQRQAVVVATQQQAGEAGEEQRAAVKTIEKPPAPAPALGTLPPPPLYWQDSDARNMII